MGLFQKLRQSVAWFFAPKPQPVAAVEVLPEAFTIGLADASEWCFPTLADIPRSVIEKHYDKVDADYKKLVRETKVPAGVSGPAYPKKTTILKEIWMLHFGQACLCCQKNMQLDNPNKKNHATIDHVLARSLGGHATNFDNLAVICRGCNNEKSGYESNIKNILMEGLIVTEEALLEAA